MSAGAQVLASTERATVLRRADGAVELRVNGVFVMDDRETSSERALAAHLDLPAHATVVVGGLGLGFTARELLGDERVETLVVAEIVDEIPRWMRDGVLPGADLFDDPRLDVRIGDVRDVVAELPAASAAAIVLDVDNGPDFLVFDENEAVYEPPFLAACAERLTPDGTVCVWSQADSPAVRAALATTFAEVVVEAVPVSLQGRDEAYWLLRGERPIRPR